MIVSMNCDILSLAPIPSSIHTQTKCGREALHFFPAKNPLLPKQKKGIEQLTKKKSLEITETHNSNLFEYIKLSAVFKNKYLWALTNRLRV